MKKSFLILLASMLILSSCVKDVFLDAGEKPKVVVECVLTEDPVQELYLSYTKGVSQKEAEPLLEAEARLIDLEKYDSSMSFANKGNGKWTLDYIPYPGHNYRLEIIIPGHDLISSETKMPSFSEVKHVFLDPSRFYRSCPGNGEAFDKIEQYGFSGGSYYYNIPDHCWVYYINDNGTIAEAICTNYPGVDSFNLTGDNYVSDTLRKTIFPYELWLKVLEGQETVDEVIKEQDALLYPSLVGQAIHDHFLRITKGELASFNLDPYAYPAVPNGKIYQECLSYFPKTYQFSGSFNIQGDTGRLCFEVLSDEYDEYLAAALRVAALEGSTEISKIFFRENIIETNIKGGLGIFGAKKKQILEWKKYYSSIDCIFNE